LHVLTTNEMDGYYADYSDHPIQHLARCLSEGFDYQGDVSPYRNNTPRGEPSGHLPASSFVAFLQNHDQVGNRALGERIHQIADPQALKAAVAILLLAPAPPLLFMGEEFAANSPFLYFCDFEPSLADAVREGRRSEFARFAKFSSPQTRAAIPDPNDVETFERSKLDWASQAEPEHDRWFRLYRNLLTIRSRTLMPHLANLKGNQASAIWKDRSLCVEWMLPRNGKLLLLANLSGQASAPLAKPPGQPIYSTHEWAVEQQMPPWTVAWFLFP
jgi:maltooligosyltrehalose trehalohydrolase